MEAYAGIDWDRKKAVAVASDETGRVRHHRKHLAPTTSAVRAFLDTVRRWNPNAQTIRVAIEHGATRWIRLFYNAGAIVHVIDPKQAKRFAQSLSSSGAKDDARDARTLLLIAQSPPHRRAPWCPPEERTSAMLALLRAHQQVATQANRTTNRLRAHLAEHFPALDDCIRDLTPRWVGRLLRACPTPERACALNRSDFDELLSGSGIHSGTRERVWCALEETEVLFSGALCEALSLTVGLLLEQLSAAREQLSRLEAALEEQLSESRPALLLRSVSGVGLQLSAGLLAYCFDGVQTHRDGASIRLGSSPVTRQSGPRRAQVSLRRSGSSRGRQLSYLLGLQATRHLSWARAMYAAGRARGQSAGTAFRRVSRSLLRILSGMLRRGEEYDEARYIRALQSRGVDWAMSLEIPASS